MILARSSRLNMVRALSRIEADGEARRRHKALGLADPEVAEVKDRGGEHRGGMPRANYSHEMIARGGAAGGAHGHAHGVGEGAGERQVIAPRGAVAIHGGEKNFAGAQRHPLAGVSDDVKAAGM